MERKKNGKLLGFAIFLTGFGIALSLTSNGFVFDVTGGVAIGTAVGLFLMYFRPRR